MKELEYVKCLLDDEGLEVVQLSETQVRGIGKNQKYVFDIWYSSKKHRFIGYTILVWKTKKYYKQIHKIEEFIKENKAQ